MKPVLGITGNYNHQERRIMLSNYYTDSVQAAGGIPLILPPTVNYHLIEAYLQICHGFILSGGGDLDPCYWGEQPDIGLREIEPLRDSFEITIARLILTAQMPVLGICRGCQVLNVAAGGTLYQDLHTGFQHMQEAPRDYAFHQVFVEDGSGLQHIIGSQQLRTNSFHHQAVKTPAPGWKISARTADGTVEAIETPALEFALGIQWHPECLPGESSARLFKALVMAASNQGGIEYNKD